MHTMHASTTNLTNRYRLSCDVRFQPANDPVDQRWSAEAVGHYNSGPMRPISEARAEWNV